MPAESINIFISNIYATAIFTGIFTLILLVIFLISRILIFKTGQTSSSAGKEKHPQKFSLYELNKDTSLLKTLLVTGMVFVMVLFLIFLLLLTMYFASKFVMDGSLYLIFVILCLILVSTVYVIKSRIINK